MKHVKKECVAMLLAGGQGSRLYALTKDMAKPAVPYGGKYRIIDFTAAFMYCPLMNRHWASRGMKVRQTLFTRISALSTDTTLTTLQYFRATTSTR